MLAISIPQPAAFRIVRGDFPSITLTVERDLVFRGRLLTHTGKTTKYLRNWGILRRWWHRIPADSQLSFGVLVGAITGQLLPADETDGTYGGIRTFEISEAIPFANPIPFPGQLGLFEVPDSIIPEQIATR